MILLYSASGAISLAHHCGHPIPDTIDRLRVLCRQMKEFNQEESLRGILPFFQVALNLAGECENPAELEGEAMDMLIGIHSVSKKDSLTGRLECSGRLALSYYFETWDMMEYLLSLIEGKYAPVKAHYSVYQGAFASGMARWELYRLKGKNIHKKKAKLTRRQMSKWVEQGGTNMLPSLLILQAEELVMERGSSQDEILKAFNTAAEAAREKNYLHQEAIAYERAATFLHSSFNNDPFREYAAKAMKIYHEWGAAAKVQTMERKFEISIGDVLSQE